MAFENGEGDQDFATIQDYVDHKQKEREATRASDDADEESDDLDESSDDGDDDYDSSNLDEGLDDEDLVDENQDEVDEDLDSDDDSDNLVDDEDDEPDQGPAIAAPRFWDPERAAEFVKLPRDLQEYVAEQEQRTVKAWNGKMREVATERRKQHETFIRKMGGLRSEAEQALDYYKDADWEVLAQRLPEKEFNAHKARFEKLTEQVKNFDGQIMAAEKEEHSFHVRERDQYLVDNLPGYGDQGPEGEKFRGRLMKYAVDEGYDPEDIAWATGPMWATLEKARQWDELQAKRASKGKRKPKPAGKTVKPNAGGKKAPTKTSGRLAKLKAKTHLSNDEYLEMKRLERQRGSRKRRRA